MVQTRRRGPRGRGAATQCRRGSSAGPPRHYLGPQGAGDGLGRHPKVSRPLGGCRFKTRRRLRDECFQQSTQEIFTMIDFNDVPENVKKLAVLCMLTLTSHEQRQALSPPEAEKFA